MGRMGQSQPSSMRFFALWMLLLMFLLKGVIAAKDTDCSVDLDTAIEQLGFSCGNDVANQTNTPTFSELLSLEAVQTFCNDTQLLYDCYEKAFNACETTSNLVDKLIQRAATESLRHVYDLREACEGASVKATLAKMFNDTTNLVCLDEATEAKIDECHFGDLDDSSVLLEDELETKLIRRRVVGTARCMLGILKDNTDCESTATELVLHILNMTVPVRLQPPSLTPIQQLDEWMHSEQRATVGVYGDPHLMVYEVGRLMTCAAAGPQVYLENSVLKVVGQNAPVNTESKATTVKQVDITFLDRATGGVLASYNSSGDKLPLTFASGNVSGDDGELQLSNASSSGIAITHGQYNYAILLDELDENYFFTVRMADALFEESSGLLVYGCPPAERMNTVPAFAALRRTNVGGANGGVNPTPADVDCTPACINATRVGGFDYHNTCTFDCMQMGTTEIAKMSMEFPKMVLDILKLDPLPTNDTDTSTNTTTDTSTNTTAVPNDTSTPSAGSRTAHWTASVTGTLVAILLNLL